MSDIEARKAFPKILARYMQEHGMNQSDVARRLNVSKQIVSDWLYGKKFPRVDKMQELARLFGVQMSDMYPNENFRVVLRETTRSRFADSLVKATTVSPIVKESPLKLMKVNDSQTRSMMKLWEVSTPETRSAVISVLKAANKTNKKE